MSSPPAPDRDRPTVVCCPDSFKGSLSALQAAHAMARGARKALGAAAHIQLRPMADGGEGTLEAIVGALGGRRIDQWVRDAIGRRRAGSWGLSADGSTAIIEAAVANGLPAVSDVELQPRRADTYGVGELAIAALDAGVAEIIVCLGGSATTDGGTGLLTALGAEFRDRAGNQVAPGGQGMADVVSIDLDGLHPRAEAVRWRLAVDVDNPLVGPRGAAAVFGPQKGADAEDVATLDAGLDHLATVVADQAGASLETLRTGSGMGAAGGMPLTLSGLLNAERVPGAQLVAETIGLPEALSGADIVLTGEGSFDSQSLDGKVVDGVSRLTDPASALVVIAGRVEVSGDELDSRGITAAMPIATGPGTLDELRARADELVAEAAHRACRLLAWRQLRGPT